MYLLFAGGFNTIIGGWHEYKGKYDSLADAMLAITVVGHVDWAHVVNVTTMRIVAGFDIQAGWYGVREEVK